MTRPQPNAPGSDLVKQAGSISQFIEGYADDFAAVVPPHIPVQAFVGLAAAQVRRDSFLRDAVQANPGSLIVALRHCAALGHLPMRGIAALVAYRSKNAPGGWEVNLIEEVGGVIERMFRAGGVQSVDCEVVRQNDDFKLRRGQLPLHEYDEFADGFPERGPLMGVYAWATMLSGATSKVVWMNRHEIARHRAMSASANSSKGPPGGTFWGPPWPAEGPNTPAMWRKTALHGLELYVPTSAAYRWELAKSTAAGMAPVRGVPSAPIRSVGTGGVDDIQEAEVVTEPGFPSDGGWDEPVDVNRDKE